MPNTLSLLPSSTQQVTHDPTKTLNGDPLGQLGDNPFGEMTDAIIFGAVNELLGWIDDATGLDLLGIVTPLESILGVSTGLLSGFTGWLTPGSTPSVAGNNVLSPIVDILSGGLSGSSATGYNLLNLQMLINGLATDTGVALQTANAAWAFAQQTMVSLAQIVQQLAVAPIYTFWGDAVNAMQFWLLGWFTNTYGTQQQTTTNTSDIGLLFAHINPVTASIKYVPSAAIPLTANYVGPDGINSGHPAFTALSGVTLLNKGDGYVGGSVDFVARAAWFTGNPMNAATDHGLITDAYHVETKLMDTNYGVAGYFVNGAVSGTTLGVHLMLEVDHESFGDSIALATYTAWNTGRTERFRVSTNNGMSYIHTSDVIAVEHDGAGHYSVLINGVSVKPDSAADYGWTDTGGVLAHGVGKREIGWVERNNGPKLGELNAYDIVAAANGVPIVAPAAVISVSAPAPRLDGKIIAPPVTLSVAAPTPTISAAPVAPPASVSAIPMGFSELQQQLASTAADSVNMQHMYDDVTTLRPKYWRMMAAWNYIAKAQDPGTPTFDTVNNVPTSSNRDWTTIDKCINDQLLTGAQIVMMIGQGHPNWSTAATYGDFCAEVANRYRPGGVGIRTDGKYAANAGRGVSIYECWNEQNNSTFWNRNVNAKEYTDYLKMFYTKIKAVPGLGGGSSILVYGGLQHILRNDYAGLWTWAGIPEIDFLTQCWDYEPNLGNYFDVMAEHIYPQTDTAAWAPGGDTAVGPAPDLGLDNMKQLQSIYDLMVAKGVGSKPLWVTEAGYSDNTLTEAQTNTYIQQLYDLLVGLGYVDAIMWYNIRDTGTDPNDFNSNFGFEDTLFRKKPVWSWMANFAVVSAPAAHINTAAPTPVTIKDVITSPAAHINTAAPAPTSIAKAVSTPAAQISTAAPAPVTIKDVITAPPAQIATAAPTPSVPGSILAPAAVISVSAPAPTTIADVVTAPVAQINTAAPNPVTVIDVITAPPAQISTAAPAPTINVPAAGAVKRGVVITTWRGHRKR